MLDAQKTLSFQPREEGLRERFDQILPFRLTDGQRQVGDEIAGDIALERPMNRLLQGDVGSGKTLVALRAMLQVADAGGQSAMLAPTEVLASQHYRSVIKTLGPLAEEVGVPVAPWSRGAVETLEGALAAGNEIGYPLMLKATAGGGGKGMKIAHNAEELPEAYRLARAEAKAAFTNDEVYIEKYLQNPRHVEMQILADNYGNVVHLGERDCSMQRRNQKVLEETPCPALNTEQRRKIGNIVTTAMKNLGYSNVGTIEFLYENGEFYFIEMNTRLQVEHPITEMVTGIDLVREQIRVASGAHLN